MSVIADPQGRRSVQVETEVPGTAEQVWQAIATGPGISAWFVRTELDERVGGKLSCDFGGGMVSSATITAWEPPHRLVAEDRTWLQDGPPVETEWTVEPIGPDACRVRVAHSLVADSDQWDHHLVGTESGWPTYFRVLRHYLEHHAGQPAASFALMAPANADAEAIWGTLARALGLPAPAVGQSVRVELGGGTVAAGKVTRIDHLPEAHGAMIAMHEPTAGVLLASGMECMGMRLASVQAYFYGPVAAETAGKQERWEEWLRGVFAAESAPPPAP